MSKNDIWYGYLQAGEKSSPVVRDISLETNSKRTIYLYNHNKGVILEYALEIVESKLRELNSEDTPLDEIRRAFKAARKAFLAGRSIKKWEKESPVATTSVPKKADEVDEVDDDILIDFNEEFEVDEIEA